MIKTYIKILHFQNSTIKNPTVHSFSRHTHIRQVSEGYSEQYQKLWWSKISPPQSKSPTSRISLVTKYRYQFKPRNKLSFSNSSSFNLWVGKLVFISNSFNEDLVFFYHWVQTWAPPPVYFHATFYKVNN